MKKYLEKNGNQSISLREIMSALNQLEKKSTWSDPVGKFLLKRLIAFYRSPGSPSVEPGVFVQDLRLIVDAFSTSAFTTEALLRWYAEDRHELERDLMDALPPRPLADQSAFELIQQMRETFPDWFVEKIKERLNSSLH